MVFVFFFRFGQLLRSTSFDCSAVRLSRLLHLSELDTTDELGESQNRLWGGEAKTSWQSKGPHPPHAKKQGPN